MGHTFAFTDFLLSLILALIMLGVGMSLTPASFRDVFRFPKTLVIGLLSQLIMLPLFAFVIARFSDMPAAFSVGLIILAACPGGTTSGLLTYFFRGNVALSISFTAINSLITLITIPFIVNLGLEYYYGASSEIHLSYISTIIQIFTITIIPALLGAFINMKKPVFAEKAKRPVKILLVLALGLIYLIYFFAGTGEGGTGITTKEIKQIFPHALLLNAICMTWGFALGIIIKVGIARSYTLGIEASVHNTTLAFLVAGSLLQNQEMLKPALIYAMFSFWTAIIFSIIVKKITKTPLFDDFRS